MNFSVLKTLNVEKKNVYEITIFVLLILSRVQKDIYLTTDIC